MSVVRPGHPTPQLLAPGPVKRPRLEGAPEAAKEESTPAVVTPTNPVPVPVPVAVVAPLHVTRPSEPLDDEGKAVAQLRDIITRLEKVLPETLPALQSELLSGLAECGSRLGSRRDTMLAEVNAVMQAAPAKAQENAELAKLDPAELLKKRMAEKLEADRKAVQEKVEKLKADLAEYGTKLDAATAKRDDMKVACDELAASAEAGADAEPEVEAKLASIAGMKSQLDIELSAVADFVRTRGLRDDKDLARQQLRDELRKVAPRLVTAKRSGEAVLEEARRVAARVLRQKEGRRLTKIEDQLFAKYDLADTGLWNKDSVKKFCNQEFGFQVSEEALDRIFVRALPENERCIPRREFLRVRALVGIERQAGLQEGLREQRLERQRKEAEEREAHSLRLQAKTSELQARLGEVLPAEGSADAEALNEKLFNSLDVAVKRLGSPGSIKDLEELRSEVAAVDAFTQPASEAAARVRQRFDALDIKPGGDVSVPVLQEWRVVKAKVERNEQRLTRFSNVLQVARNAMTLRRFVEAEGVRPGIIKCLRETMQTEKLSAEDLFSSACAKSSEEQSEEPRLSLADYVSILTASGYEGDEADARKFFYSSSQERDHITKDQFCFGLTRFYRVEQSCLMQTQLTLKGAKPVRKLEVGEVVEFLAGPEEEAQTKLMRIRGRAVKDGAEGWASLATNTKGKVFMTELVNEYRTKSDIVLHEEPGGGTAKKIVRQLRRAEPVEIVQWDFEQAAVGGGVAAAAAADCRIRVRARKDGAFGWTFLSKLESGLVAGAGVGKVEPTATAAGPKPPGKVDPTKVG